MDGDVSQTRVSRNGTTEITTVLGAKNCRDPTVSNDGDLLVFTTRAETTPGGTNGQNRFQIWLRNLTTTDTYLVSGLATGPNGRINPPGKGSPRAMISGAGQHVVFESAVDNFLGDTTSTRSRSSA